MWYSLLTLIVFVIAASMSQENDEALERLEEKLFDTLAEYGTMVTFNGIRNELTDLPPGTFKNNRGLTVIQLQNHNITVLRNNTFKPLSKLELLILSKNNITEIEVDTFSGLTSIDRLDLSSNKLENLPIGAFKDLKKMKHLDLSHNIIKALRCNTFEGLEDNNKLELFLAYNSISYIEPNTFRNYHLWTLSLRHNALTTLKADAFNGVYIRTYLDLSYNSAMDIKAQAFRNFSANLLFLEKTVITAIDRRNWGLDDSILTIGMGS